VATVLVCVRSLAAAKAIAACADRLGVAAAVRVATSGVETMARLAERPSDVILLDGAAIRTDPVGNVRQVVRRAPDAALVLFGTQNRAIAAGAVAAGARGVIEDAGIDLIATVAKILFLIGIPGRLSPSTRPAGPSPGRPPWPPVQAAGPLPGAGPLPAAGPLAALGPQPVPGELPTPGPLSTPARAVATDVAEQSVPGRPQPVGGPAELASSSRQPVDGEPDQADGPDQASPASGYLVVPVQRGDALDGTGDRRPSLTEREMQVLRGMTDGKSNAEIGRDLYVSEDTVKTHARRLFRKLGARDRAHAVATGFRAGLVS
jgi:DNA-binding NarL/FixJ family response regulator